MDEPQKFNNFSLPEVNLDPLVVGMNIPSGKAQPTAPAFFAPQEDTEVKLAQNSAESLPGKINPAGLGQETNAREDMHRTFVAPSGQTGESYDSHQSRTRVGREGILKEEYIFHIETHRIKPNPNQPRKDFEESSLKELSDSIKEHGLLHPVVVSRIVTPTPTGQNVEYQLIAGERRWRASQMAGLPTMPAIIKDSTEKSRLELGLVENLQRENLNPIETAMAFRRLNEEFSLSQKEIGLKMGKAVSTVANTLRLLSLPPKIQEALSSNKIFEGHARAILALTSSEQQLRLFEAVISGNMTVRETEEEARVMKSSALRKGKNVVVLNPYFRELIDRLEDILGTKVTLMPKGEGGKLTIEYYSAEELEGLIKKLSPNGE